MFSRIAKTLSIVALSVSTLTATANAQLTDRELEAINARLMVGTFSRLCAAPGLTPQSVVERALDRKWEVSSAVALGDNSMQRYADQVWRDDFGGGDGNTIDFMLFIQPGEDDTHLKTCGIRFENNAVDDVAYIIENSALYDRAPEDAPAIDDSENVANDQTFCVAQYPVASQPHQITLRPHSANRNDGFIFITRSEDPDAEGCPLSSPDQ